ncbi:MAG TPA: hypothetical protein VM658_13405 [bacterium]|nr:hypothetical protein [bacterium]
MDKTRATMAGPGLRDDWLEFVSLVEHRLEQGAVEYGDSTMRRPALEVLDEVEQELLDVMGWSFFAWLRIRRLKEKVKKALTEISQGDGE